VAFRGAVILLAREGALPLVGGEVNDFLTQQALISLVEIDQDPTGSLIFFESSDPLVKGLLLVIKLNIAAGDEPNKGVL
jgi:hypothetical protein